MSEPLTNLGGWDEIYREDFFGQPLPQREGLLKRNACATKHRDKAPQGDSIKDSIKARLTAVKQRLNAVINAYLLPGDEAEDEEEDEVARTRAANDLEGALSGLLRSHEEARAKDVKDLVDKAMSGHKRWRLLTPEEQASRNYSHFAAQEVLKKFTRRITPEEEHSYKLQNAQELFNEVSKMMLKNRRPKTS
jgi:hypothetical protein